MDAKAIVRQGYDQVSYAYRGEEPVEELAHYREWLGAITPLLTPGTAVLDLGCGCGVPVAQTLAGDFDVTGVDISPVQIERARALAPEARFLCADMTAVEFPEAHFAAIVSFYAIIHVPLAEQRPLLAKLYTWLRPGGYLMLTVGRHAWTGTEADWLGVAGATMYWSHADAPVYREWLTGLGFQIAWTRFIPEGSSGHELILAQKPAD